MNHEFHFPQSFSVLPGPSDLHKRFEFPPLPESVHFPRFGINRNIFPSNSTDKAKPLTEQSMEMAVFVPFPKLSIRCKHKRTHTHTYTQTLLFTTKAWLDAALCLRFNALFHLESWGGYPPSESWLRKQSHLISFSSTASERNVIKGTKSPLGPATCYMTNMTRRVIRPTYKGNASFFFFRATSAAVWRPERDREGEVGTASIAVWHWTDFRWPWA